MLIFWLRSFKSTSIYEIHIFELRMKIELYVDHRSEGVSTEAVEKKKPEEIQA